MARILLVGAILAASMYAIAHGDLLAKARLVGTCTLVVAPAGDGETWHACRSGRLEGRPDLRKRSCSRQGFAGDAELWRCPARLVGSRST